MTKYIDATPFLLASTDHPDFNESDAAKDSLEVSICNDAIDDLLSGNMSARDLCDLLESYGEDPQEYADMVTENVQYLMGKAYQPSESGLLIPSNG